jgi:hypothetical protein
LAKLPKGDHQSDFENDHKGNEFAPSKTDAVILSAAKNLNI